MSFRALFPALVAAWPVLAVSCPAEAKLGQGLRKTVVAVEAPAALPVSEPLRDRFGIGTMPALSALLPLRDWALLGLRLRWGFLSNGPPPADPTIKDPGYGGLSALTAVARLRPSAAHFANSLLEGPWLEIGAGPGLTGSLVRAVGEVALGWNTRVARISFGPSVRYLYVVQPANALDSADAQLVLVGLEVGLHDSPPRSVVPATPATPPGPADRDGDGIPDDVDKCPIEAEDKDGFEDENGCPDLDNDGDGIPDEADACPSQPETVNGFEDEDGCPDEAPATPEEERILLEERVLFDTNSTSVAPTGRSELAGVARLWKQHPEWDRLVIDGHADRRGTDEYNLQLSRDRAKEVYRLLVEMGLAPEKLRIRTYGNRKPRVPGENAEADRANRRVEFVVVKKNHEAAAAASPAAASAKAPATAPSGAEEP